MEYLKLVRWANLLMIALTQYLVRYMLIQPPLIVYGLQPILNHVQFLLFVLSTVFISAGGYIINDYFDIKIDAINKPDELTVGRTIKRRYALTLHLILSGIGVALAFFIGYYAGNWQLGFIQVIATALLFIYSQTYKRSFLIGNLMIAVLTATAVLAVPFYEYLSLATLANLHPETATVYDNITRLIIVYTIFAFYTTLIREIAKDAQDVVGDSHVGSRSLPVVWGLKATKWIVAGLTFVLVASLIAIQIYLFKQGATLEPVYLFLVLIMALGALFSTMVADKPSDYKRVSLLLKLTMLFGVLHIAVSSWEYVMGNPTMLLQLG